MTSMIEKAQDAVSSEHTSSEMGRSGGSFRADNRDPIPNTLLPEWAWRFAAAHAVLWHRGFEFVRQPR
jgi:hypothetical protein